MSTGQPTAYLCCGIAAATAGEQHDPSCSNKPIRIPMSIVPAAGAPVAHAAIAEHCNHTEGQPVASRDKPITIWRGGSSITKRIGDLTDEELVLQYGMEMESQSRRASTDSPGLEDELDEELTRRLTEARDLRVAFPAARRAYMAIAHARDSLTARLYALHAAIATSPNIIFEELSDKFYPGGTVTPREIVVETVLAICRLTASAPAIQHGHDLLGMATMYNLGADWHGPFIRKFWDSKQPGWLISDDDDTDATPWNFITHEWDRTLGVSRRAEYVFDSLDAAFAYVEEHPELVGKIIPPAGEKALDNAQPRR